MNNQSSALKGIKVVEVAIADVGPFMSQYLGSFGAQVVKVESRLRPDINRVSAPYKDNIVGVNRSGVFVYANNNKLSLALNLKHPRAREVMRSLVSWADVFIGGYPPDTMRSLNLVYEEFKKIKADIIMMSTSGKGDSGPYSQQPAWGFNLRGYGFDQLVGWPDRMPAGTAVAYTDRVSPWFGVTAILAALDFHRRTGQGQYIDMAQVEASLHFLTPALLDFFVNDRVLTRAGNESSCAAPHNAYRCLGDDRWCVIAVFNDEQWSGLCQALGNPDWANDPNFETFTGRKRNCEDLDRLIESWTVNYPPEQVMAIMQANHVPAGIVQTTEDIIDKDLHLAERGLFQKLDTQDIGSYPHRRPPAVLSKTPSSLSPAPLLGQDTEYVCTKLIGISDQHFVGLLESGVFE